MIDYRVSCAEPSEAIKALMQQAVWWHRAQGKRREVHHKPPKCKRKTGTEYVPVLSWKDLWWGERLEAIKGTDLANHMGCWRTRSPQKKKNNKKNRRDWEPKSRPQPSEAIAGTRPHRTWLSKP
jgi:hypothetical protein